jgi:hypothetical protein
MPRSVFYLGNCPSRTQRESEQTLTRVNRLAARCTSRRRIVQGSGRRGRPSADRQPASQSRRLCPAIRVQDWSGIARGIQHCGGSSSQASSLRTGRPWTRAHLRGPDYVGQSLMDATLSTRNASPRPPRCCHGVLPTSRKSPALILAVHAWQLAAPTVNDVHPSLRRLWVRVPRGPPAFT